jgi:sigma-B regulation protein RsbU (phosphoserine phosphatase)
MWGVLGVRLDSLEFEWHARRAITQIASAINEHLEHIDRERLRDIRARIDRKILEQRRPKALFYEILHGLRSLTEYDHSASLLIFDDEANRLELVAEQIAWRKAKSQKVGLKLPLTDELRQLLGASTVYRFDRTKRAWKEWKDRPATALARLLDYNRSDTPCREESMLCAPLVARDDVLGLLKVAAKSPGTFGPHEAKLVSRFLPQASVAVQNLQRTETLQMKMIDAERKHAMADLARGVSHDVNNALGSILPLVQQLRADISSGQADPTVTAEDLKEIERSVQLCRRIFGGMLSFARGAARTTGEAHVQPAVECTLGILKDGMARRGIEIDVDVPRDLPPVTGAQSDLEQVLLNLLTNARDAMPAGGLLSISAGETNGVINLVVEDTGCGIPRDHLADGRKARYQERARQGVADHGGAAHPAAGPWCPMTRGARILIVDDDQGMIRAVERVLGRQYNVVTASTPTEALDLADSFDPDLAILDIRMPVMNGFELMRRLGDAHDDLDVIFMTGSVTDADAHLVRAIQEGAFYFIQKPFERAVLQALVERCLELRRLRQEKHQHMRKLERELEEARLFQVSLLPPVEARVAGVSISARYTACDELGGDLYDYAAAGPGRAAVLVADVSGHGASAAMMTGIVKSAFHAAEVDGYEPQAVLNRVAAGIREFEPHRFVTLFCARLGSATPVIEYANAGHPAAVVWGAGGEANLLEATGPLISSGFRTLPWESQRLKLAPGDQLLVYTDGITETRSGNGEFFGTERVIRNVTASRKAGQALLDELLLSVEAFSGNRPRGDDLTLLAASLETAGPDDQATPEGRRSS